MKLPNIYQEFRSELKKDIYSLGGMSIEVFNESNIESEQINLAIGDGDVEFSNIKKWKPSYLIIAAGEFNEPHFVDTDEVNPKVYLVLPHNGIWGRSCICNSLIDYRKTLIHIDKLEMALLKDPDNHDIIEQTFKEIRVINKNTDLEYWEVWYAEVTL